MTENSNPIDHQDPRVEALQAAYDRVNSWEETANPEKIRAELDDAIVESVRPFWEAGFTDVALVQIGGDTQDRFLDEVSGPLLEKLRQASS